MKIIYESFDGEQFENKTECVKHEQFFFKSKVDEFFNMVSQVREYCNNTDDCKDCPFYRENKENTCGFREITQSCPWEW